MDLDWGKFKMNISRTAQLIVLEQNSVIKTFTVTEGQAVIGRIGGANNFGLATSFVSGQHFYITIHNNRFFFADLASTNGTYLNNILYKSSDGRPTAYQELFDGDVLSIGDPLSSNKVFMLFSTTTNDVGFEWRSINLNTSPRITIGRDQASTICLPNINVSRKHALIEKNGSSAVIKDLGSSNGTILNNSIVKGVAELTDNSVIRIGNDKLVKVRDDIIYSVARPAKSTGYTVYRSYDEIQRMKRLSDSQHSSQEPSGVEQSYDIGRQGGVEVRVENISRIVPCKTGTGENGGNKKYILRNVSLTVNPGELVAILGGSGAGKTTFMNCINGFEPATEGRVFINNTELYKNYQSIKSSIGYVPQQDIVHDDLTLEDMLTYTAKLRLPKDVSKSEIGQRVTEVMDMVDLTAQKDTYIKKLSGGQRKRASIAVELVSDPTLFFLDEPTSGLDPEAENNLMNQLRGLSTKKGKTVIVITHTLQNIKKFDKVIFLAPGGKLCFFGTPASAEEFFEVDNLTEAYEKISGDIDGYVKRYNALISKEGK